MTDTKYISYPDDYKIHYCPCGNKYICIPECTDTGYCYDCEKKRDKSRDQTPIC